MPVVVEEYLEYVPGSPAGQVQTSNGPRRIFVDDVSYESPWPIAGAPHNADIALSLTFDAVLSRVRIVATGMEPFTLATVERSADQIKWTTVRGGGALGISAGTLRLDDYEFAPNVVNYYRVRTLVPFGQSEVGSITPAQTSMWLKSVARPFLNLTVSLLGDSHTFDRPERGATFDVVGRSLPVAVTDVRGSRRYMIKVRTDTFNQGDALDLLLASGDILFLQGMADSVITRTGVYVFAGPTTAEYPIAPDPMRFTSISLIECAAPGPDVVGATSSWQTVINTYATWADVIAANATWADLLELVGSPPEVIVG